MKKILIMGLPGAGKTTLAKVLTPKLNAVWYNADFIRNHINKDLGFSPEDRIEQAKRMGLLCNCATVSGHYAIADFVCPTIETREAFDADFVIWVDRIKEGRFENTNKLFQEPEHYDVRVTSDGTPEEWADTIIEKLAEGRGHDPHTVFQVPTG